LVERARLGDGLALEQLLRDNHDRIYAVCRRLTANDADAADATQEALIAVVRGLPRFDGRSQFSTWVYRIAVNASIDELRRRSRRPVPGLENVHLTAAPSDETVATAVDVESAVMQLPVDYRAPVVLRDMCGLDYAEIEEILEIPAGTVKSRIARGRAALVRMLDPAGTEP
jgi:RNA polymerase sigma-70 factor, ECF subfamily